MAAQGAHRIARGFEMPMRSLMGACVVAVCCAAGAEAAGAPEDAAQAAAESWLRSVDDASYGVSWEQAAKTLKGAVKQDQWEQMASSVRTPLGRLTSRRLRSREYTEKPPSAAFTTSVVGGRVYTWGGATDGKYVVVQFDTAFANKPSAVETVVSMLDPDGVWRVSGYTIR
jgi:hypothetical protein